VNLAAGVVLDSGAFIALERRDRVMVALTRLFVEAKTPLVTSAGVLAQVWRGGGDRQVPVAYLLRRTAREREWPVLTSDPEDLLAIAPGLDVERV
jgi:hypothetical protein